MRTKLLMFLMAVGMLLAVPTITYAQMTDEDIDFEGGDSGNSDFGPVSIDPILINGSVSHTNKTVTINFLFDLGPVVIWVVDEKGHIYISEEVNSSTGAKITIDTKALSAQKYTIICFTCEGQLQASFDQHTK